MPKSLLRKGIRIFLAAFWLTIFAACASAESLTPLPAVTEDSFEQKSAQVISYDLGETIIVQDQFPEDSPFRNMPARLLGVIGVPAGAGSHPVVLILHGSHRICLSDETWPCPPDEEQFNYAGFIYLVDALANAGYVALSINLNPEFTFAFGEAPPTLRTIQLIDAHLQELAAANRGESQKFGVDLLGKADLSRMVWIGHSRGGDYVNWIVREQNLEAQASPTGYGPVQGLILMAPSAFAAEALPAVDLPMAVILPACDSDVILLDGQRYYESARFDPARTQPVISIYLEGGNHENFNTLLEPGNLLPDRPDCAPDLALTPEAQQDFMAQYALGFLKWRYADPADQAALAQNLGLGTVAPPPSELYNHPVQINTLFPAAQRLDIVVPESEVELHTHLLGGEVQMEGVDTLFCPQGYYTPEMDPEAAACRRVSFNQPGYPQQLVLSWEQSGERWRALIPESARDLSDYSSLYLRVALDPLSERNAPGEGQAFSVALSDSNRDYAPVALSDLSYPIGKRKPSEFFEGDTFSGHIYMKTYLIPLSSFNGIDLANISEIDLVFDQRETGTLFIADLALLR